MSNSPKKRKRKGERPDGLIQVSWTDGQKPDGSPNRKFFYGRTREEANYNRDEYKRIRKLGIAANRETMTVSEWVDEWYARYKTKVNPDYETGYKVPINRLKKALGDRLIKSIHESDLQEELDSIADMSASTIEKYYSVIVQVFKKARRNKIIPDNPAEELAMPDGTDGSHRALNRWESDCILEHWHEHRSGIWAMLMLLCGLRRGEMIALNWSNIDLEKRRIFVREAAVVKKNQTAVKPRTKTSAGIRVLPICQPLYDALKSVPSEQRVGRVCVSAKGKQLSLSAFERGWDGFNLAMQRILNNEPIKQKGRRESLEKKIEKAKKEGREYIIFSTRSHDLRHTFATALYDAGVPVKAAQYYLGHADIRMTLDLYTHLSEERENTSRALLTNYLDAWFKTDYNEYADCIVDDEIQL